MSARQFPHFDFPYLDFPYVGKWQKEKRQERKPKVGSKPFEQSRTMGLAGSLFFLIVVLLSSPFWLAGWWIARVLSSHPDIHPSTIFISLLFAGIHYYFFLLLRRLLHQLRQRGTHAWIPLFVLLLLFIAGIPAWTCYQFLGPVIQWLGSPACYAAFPAIGIGWLLLRIYRLQR